jgi:hypothetical protein
VFPALQPDVDLAAAGVWNDCEHAPWTGRYNLRGYAVDQHGTLRGFAGVEPNAVDNDLTPGNPVGGINI